MKSIILALIVFATIITNLDEIYKVGDQVYYGEICTENKIIQKASGAIVVDGLWHRINYVTRTYQGTCQQWSEEAKVK